MNKLSVVSVPIGNIDDITLRAINVLKEADYIVSEDTRETGRLLSLLNIPRKELISYREQNHDRTFPYILNLILNNANVAIVSDRGTPGIADPGFRLIREAIKEDIEIVTVPGPSSAIAALSISGLPTNNFTFLGFLPRKKGKQIELLKKFIDLETTFITFESPFRILSLLENIQEEIGEINIALAHELTKKHEEVIRGTVSEVIEILKKRTIKGEWVVMGRKQS